MRIVFSVLVAFLATVCQCQAKVTFLGPTPYLSVEDSPFDMSGLGSTFFFDDFEDGSFDLPPGVTTFPHLIRGPAPDTDSVDADDGLVDGSGNGGHSLTPTIGIMTPTYPPTWYSRFELTFDRDELGFLPNAFGIAWTDALPSTELAVVVYDETGPNGLMQNFDLMDKLDNGATFEDVFVGAVSATPFASVTVYSRYQGFDFTPLHFELDHVQFGLVVPEPATRLGLLLACSLLVICKRRHFTFLLKEQCHVIKDLGRGGGGVIARALFRFA